MDRGELELTAQLALIELDDSRLELFEKSVGELIDHLAVMSSFDVTGLAPTTHALQEENRLRSDSAGTDPDLPDLILDQASDLEDRFISIPNVL
jgi:aspartyl-tRNA(Asn)/glutamyl-tRNA(Gln) amidotransferase subunit C